MSLNQSNQIRFDEFQSPPWIFISYNNSLLAVNDSDGAPPFDVTGRDDSLLRILARKMNFQFRYIDVQAAIATDNATLPGELGLEMLMRRVINSKHVECQTILVILQEADLLFGDIVVTYERMQDVEFSFFTLPDSGAFLTHAPRRLSEAFALVYPFQKDVWPPLLVTVVLVGPILYVMVLIINWTRRVVRRRPPSSYHSIVYIREMRCRRVTRDKRARHAEEGLLSRCVWFTCHIFLRQCW